MRPGCKDIGITKIGFVTNAQLLKNFVISLPLLSVSRNLNRKVPSWFQRVERVYLFIDPVVSLYWREE